jgi:hypothetical protein
MASGSNRLVQSEIVGKGGSEKELTSALENANNYAKQCLDKPNPRKKGNNGDKVE